MRVRLIDQLTARAFRRRFSTSSTVPPARSAGVALQAKRPSSIAPGAAMALDLAAYERLLDGEGEKLDSAGGRRVTRRRS
jgi:hypothetical protein